MTNPKEPDSDLTALKARALKAYATKDYAASSDLYAQACEAQKAVHGADDAHLLYLYGRALYKVAIGKSDVLGGGESAPAKKTDSKGKGKGKEMEVIGEDEEEVEGKGKGRAVEKDEAPNAKKGVFSFAGDENWDDVSDEDGEQDAEASGDAEEAEDEMSAAWEILDLARILFEKQLSPASTTPPTTSPSSPSSTSPTTDDTNPDASKATKIMLADVYDLLGEVSLESESFAQARSDLAASLALKQALYAPESTLISEAHFKLSLALEFLAATEGMGEDESAALREDAAREIEASIASCKARIRKEGEGAASDEVAEMVGELEMRLRDLRAPVEGVEDPLAGRRGIWEGLGGGVVRKKEKAVVKEQVKEEAKTEAKEEGKLEVKAEESAGASRDGSRASSVAGKRKVEDLDEDDAEEEVKAKDGGKKARVEVEVKEDAHSEEEHIIANDIYEETADVTDEEDDDLMQEEEPIANPPSPRRWLSGRE
ncbi:hypothetical protein EDC01DRAFT_788676 [Geopyxis carbonaria]|nr:hypothetical protein EDC01DRAFT_788676 [Geopyxis carbonaria]